MVRNVISSSKKPSCKPSFAIGIVKAKSSVLLTNGILILPLMEDCAIELSLTSITPFKSVKKSLNLIF